MDVPVQVFPISDAIKAASAPEVITRRSADFHPTIWGDYFLKYSAPHLTDIDGDIKKEHQRLRDEVREMIVEADEELPHKLNLLDTVQRLGVSYHFESEIEAALQHICENFSHIINGDKAYSDDLHTVSLLFRLLRQQGHPISCNVFNRFKDKDGKFKESLSCDVKGMLSLYEASHLRVRGEDILDKALRFTTTRLEFLAPSLTNPLATQVNHALKQPIHTGVTRLEARCFISFYEDHDSHNKFLLKFARLDFNLLQKLHQSELSDITRWWINLDIARKLPFARDRVVECYFWTLGVYYEPNYSLARRILTKVTNLTSIIDDIYDVYGTLEELALFAEAIERWDSDAKDQLPEYMRVCYQALLDVYCMVNEEMANEGRSYRVDYAKAAMKDQVKAYFNEAKWFHKGYVPTVNEYMPVALMSSNYPMLATTSLVGMGELVTKESFDWVSSNPLIVQASTVIARLMNDMVEHEKTGAVASAVECYMKEHGASEEDVLVELKKQVTNAWKDMNAECLRPTAVPMPLLVRFLNLARLANAFYTGEDSYTNAGTKGKAFVTSTLVDPVPINTQH